MTQPADWNREEWIALLVSGELDPGDPQVAERLAADPDLAREVAELQAMALAVGDSAPPSGWDEDGGDESEELVLQGFREQLAAETTASDHSAHAEPAAPRVEAPFSWTPILLRLAAVLAFLLLGRAALVTEPIPRTPPAGPGTTYLGDGRIEIPEDFPFGTLRWKLDDQFFFFPRVDVRVHAENGNGLRGRLIAEFVEIEGAHVQLSDEQLEGVRFLLYEITVRDDGAAQPYRLDVRQRR